VALIIIPATVMLCVTLVVALVLINLRDEALLPEVSAALRHQSLSDA
jgi:hypothetical protein